MEFVQGAFKSDHQPSSVANGFHVQPNEEEDEEELEGACALPLKKEGPQLPDKNSEDFIQMETCKVLELFPVYGAGYVRRLLAFYDNNSETVIARILEGKKSLTFDLIY